MALINDWDIRLESYSDAASVTSVTDQVGTDDLSISIQSVGFPTYSSAEDEIVFAGSQSLGVGTISSTLQAALKSTAWTIAANINTANPASGNFVFSAGNSGSANLAIWMIINAGTAEIFVRNEAGTSTSVTTASADITANTDSVVFIWRNGSTFGVAVDGGTAATTTGSIDLSADTFDQVGFGARHRSSVDAYYTGGLISARIYDSDESANRSSISSEMLSGASFGIDSTDASMQRDTSFDVTFSNPATTPTTGNTSLSNGGDTLPCSAVTGSGPYTATFTVGDLTKQVDATGYDWTLTVDAETDTTGNIPLVIQAGWTKVDLVSPVTTNGSILFGATGDAPVTGDDAEYTVTSVLDSGVSFSVAPDGVWTVTEAVEGDWVTDITVDRRLVQSNGTIGSTDTLTLDASTGSSSTSTAVVSALVSNIVSDLVN